MDGPALPRVFIYPLPPSLTGRWLYNDEPSDTSSDGFEAERLFADLIHR